jgi:hypothetical protein
MREAGADVIASAPEMPQEELAVLVYRAMLFAGSVPVLKRGEFIIERPMAKEKGARQPRPS